MLNRHSELVSIVIIGTEEEGDLGIESANLTWYFKSLQVGNSSNK